MNEDGHCAAYAQATASISSAGTSRSCRAMRRAEKVEAKQLKADNAEIEQDAKAVA